MSSPARSLIVLGGGSSQISALRRAVDFGFEVILVDRDPDATGRRWAHRFENASTFDIDAVEKAVRRSGAAALIAVGSDQPVYTAAVVSHRVGLPFPLLPEQARGVTNKAKMKARLGSADVPLVPWRILGRDPTQWGREGFEELSAPWVVKPLDSQGQRGIRLVHTREELERCFPITLSFSRESRFLVEEYYPSREITVSGWAEGDGVDPTIWTITDRVTFDPTLSLGVCLGHRFPSEAARGVEERVREITARIVRVFSLREVPIYFQMLVGDRGVLVNEIACRLGGAYEDQSIPLVTGIDILGKQLAWYRDVVSGTRTHALRDDVLRGSRSHAPSSRVFAVPLIFARAGVVARLRGADALRNYPGVADCRFLLPVGTRIEPMANSTQRIAYAVLHGPDADSVNTLVNTVFDTLRVESATGENLLIDTRAEIHLHSGV